MTLDAKQLEEWERGLSVWVPNDLHTMLDAIEALIAAVRELQEDIARQRGVIEAAHQMLEDENAEGALFVLRARTLAAAILTDRSNA